MQRLYVQTHRGIIVLNTISIQKVIFMFGNIFFKAIIVIVIVVLFVKFILGPILLFVRYYLKYLLYTCLLLIPLYFFIPTHIDEIIYFIVIGIVAILSVIIDFSDDDDDLDEKLYYTNNIDDNSDYNYVLNKKTRIAFKKGDPAIYTIREENREYSNASEEELFRKGYRLKRDP